MMMFVCTVSNPHENLILLTVIFAFDGCSIRTIRKQIINVFEVIVVDRLKFIRYAFLGIVDMWEESHMEMGKG